jgi:hypothetical protein
MSAENVLWKGSVAPCHCASSDSSETSVTVNFLPLALSKSATAKARAAARCALELDPTLAEPRATLAFVAMYYDWNWNAAEDEFRRAIALDPTYATAQGLGCPTSAPLRGTLLRRIHASNIKGPVSVRASYTKCVRLGLFGCEKFAAITSVSIPGIVAQ